MTTADPARTRRMVDPRDAFSELAQMCLDEESMDSVLNRVAVLAQKAIPGVAEASVTLVLGEKPTTAAFTGDVARDLDESQYGLGHGPCLEAAVGGDVQEIADARQETRWADHARRCVERGALSSMSVALPVQETLHGALNLYATDPHAFDDDARAVARGFAAHAAVAVHNMHLYESTRELAENLDIAMRSRAVIEQAKGILMAQRRCDPAEAFTLLSAASQRSNRKLRDIAQAIVDGVKQ